MSEKKKVRFTAVDAVVLVVVLAVIAFVGIKVFGIGTASDADSADKKTYIVSYYFEEVPDFAASQIKAGDKVTDDIRNHSLGKVTNVEIGEAAVYCADSNGMLHKSAKEGYCSVKLTTEVEALKYTHGIEVSKANYVVGHSMTLYAGGAKLYGRVAAIKEK